MFADTLARVASNQTLGFGAPIIVCGIDHLGIVQEELLQANVFGSTIILEPMARNTASALAAAALVQAQADPDALMLVLPADHVITKPEKLHQACLDAYECALSGKIVTFAIKPDGPQTGYGYIKSGNELSRGVFTVESFREKPDLETAKTYIEDGSYAWNAGIFYFKASALIAELQAYAPDVVRHVRDAVHNSELSSGALVMSAEAFSQAPSISIDYAVMELTVSAAVVPVDMGWSDVGSFATLWELGDKDSCGNVAKGEVAFVDASNCYVNGSELPIALIGVSDLLVVSTPQGLLITTRDRAQDVRLAADAFKS
jgi:mannose-1-phosphate guanylyltransferase/mannose-6-phosphate isomerase